MTTKEELNEKSWEKQKWAEQFYNLIDIAGEIDPNEMGEFILGLLQEQKEHYEVRIKAYEDPVPSRMAELIENVKKEQKAKILELIEGERAMRDDEPLTENANDTEIYNKEAQNNMADGFNYALDTIKSKINNI